MTTRRETPTCEYDRAMRHRTDPSCPPPTGRTLRDLSPDDALALADALGRAALHPDRGELLAALFYWATLSRPPDAAHAATIAQAIRAGTVTRREILEEFLRSPEFRELALVERLLRDARAIGALFEPGAPPIVAGMTERVVEVPWVLSRYRGERRVLDVGYANALSVYLIALQDLRIPHLHGIDLSPARVPWILGTSADARAMPYRDGSFELALCVSSLEHVGYDNVLYGTPQEFRPRGDIEALFELERVLVPGGRLLVTVPFGRREQHVGFHQYDRIEWAELVGRTRLVVEECHVFRLGDGGWIREVDDDAMANVPYGEMAARGVLCAGLRKSPA